MIPRGPFQPQTFCDSVISGSTLLSPYKADREDGCLGGTGSHHARGLPSAGNYFLFFIINLMKCSSTAFQRYPKTLSFYVIMMRGELPVAAVSGGRTS